ncbi:MAG: DUF3189 family protein [Dethiobacteria bacterium]|jgi:hypothetical protein
MKIIYHCYGGTHSSVLGAATHLGILDSKRIPTNREILNCPYFDQVENDQLGSIFFIGIDEKGHEVYIMGCKSAGTLVEKVIKDFCKIMQINGEEVMLVSTKPSINMLLRIGGLLSRRLKLVTLGRFFLFPGSKLALPKIRKIVKKVNLDRELTGIG